MVGPQFGHAPTTRDEARRQRPEVGARRQLHAPVATRSRFGSDDFGQAQPIDHCQVAAYHYALHILARHRIQTRRITQRPVMQDRNSITTRRYIVKQMSRENHRTAFCQRADQIAQGQCLDWIEASSRLIEHHQIGLMDNRLGNSDTLPEALRQASNQALALIDEITRLHRDYNRPSDLLSLDAVQACAEAQVFLDRQFVV